MQEYGETFAQVYDARWSGFARRIAPIIREHFERTSVDIDGARVLDLCCGTGQLALHFLEHGYHVTCLDRSPHMLEHVRKKTASFTLPSTYALVVATYDALNHLDGLGALEKCVGCVHQTLRDGGQFIFDLNTRKGLKRWTGFTFENDDEITVLNRGIFSRDMDRAYIEITGFVRNED